uniref:Uncharacterized protein n=2 Tax=Panagrolaimus TaxID=55784 RepID=A0A914Z1E4_9BILA
MSNLPSQLFRFLMNSQQPNQNIHLPQVEHNWPAAAVAAASASTSGNTTDLAQNATSVENNVDNNFVDSVGIEGSETSSSTSSANTQAMISPRHQQQQQHQIQSIHHHHQQQQQQHLQHQQGSDHLTPQTSISNSSAAALSMFNGHNGGISLEAIQRALTFPHITNSLPNTISSTSNAAFMSALNAAAQSVAAMNGTQQTPLPPSMQLPINPSILSATLASAGGRPNSRTTNGPANERGNNGGGAGGPITVNNERRKASTDDFVKNIRQCQMTDEDIRKIEIPVPEALKYDQNFRPASEEQIIQQIMTSKKYETMDVQETMIQLCKKLAEKRVFGSRLMADTTVAAPNHSNYTNLPDKGIIYILHVCKKVLGPRVKSEDEFWEYFRDAMRKLAARCRRVRHAKKVRSQNHYVLGNSNSNTMVTITSNAASPSIFASAQTLVDDERSSRSSTASNPSHTITSITSTINHHHQQQQQHLNNVNSSSITGNRPFTPLSTTTATLTPSSSNTSPTQPDGASPKST